MASVKMDSKSNIWLEQEVEKVDPLKKKTNYLLLLIFLPMVKWYVLLIYTQKMTIITILSVSR